MELIGKLKFEIYKVFLDKIQVRVKELLVVNCFQNCILAYNSQPVGLADVLKTCLVLVWDEYLLSILNK
jgi:hypothetical protein